MPLAGLEGEVAGGLDSSRGRWRSLTEDDLFFSSSLDDFCGDWVDSYDLGASSAGLATFGLDSSLCAVGADAAGAAFDYKLD